MEQSRAEATRLIELAAATGLRALLGPAALAVADRRDDRDAWVLGAVVEMVADKVPLAPRGDSLLGLLVRSILGAWSGQQLLRRYGVDAPLGPVMGATVAVGTGLVAGVVRRALGTILPGFALSLTEDYLALRLAASAVDADVSEFMPPATRLMANAKREV